MNREEKGEKRIEGTGLTLSAALEQLTPYVAPRKDALLLAIQSFWQIPDALHLSIVSEDQRPPNVSKHAIVLRIESNTGGQRAEVAMQVSEPPDKSVSLHYVSGSRGILRLLHANLADGPTSTAKQALKAAWDDFFPFRMMRDGQFREVFSTHDDIGGRIRLGYRCNQDCWFCWQGRSWPSPPEGVYRAWIDQMADLGVRSLNITGGEPTTYTNLPDLIAQAHDHGMSVSIQSNAIKLGRMEYLKRLVENGLDFVMVSYHSPDADESDRMTRAPKTHHRTQQGLTNLATLAVPFSLNCVVERTNLANLPALAADIVTRFVDPFPECSLKRVSFSHPFEYFEGGWSEAVVTVEEAKPYLVNACRTLHTAGIPFQITGTCGFPLCVFSEDHDLLNTQRLLGFDYAASEVSHRTFVSSCDACDVKAACQGVRKVYHRRFGDPIVTPIKLK